MMNSVTNTRHRLHTAVIAFNLLLASAAIAQETSNDGSPVVYPASYFQQWGPTTAQDMLDRIPGQASTGSSSRGGGGSSTGRSSSGSGFGNPSDGGRGLGQSSDTFKYLQLTH